MLMLRMQHPLVPCVVVIFVGMSDMISPSPSGRVHAALHRLLLSSNSSPLVAGEQSRATPLPQLDFCLPDTYISLAVVETFHRTHTLRRTASSDRLVGRSATPLSVEGMSFG